MEWVESVNQAMGYIEAHLDQKIDFNEISRICACPVTVFQRFFVLATGVTLNEYIRRRRLTCAMDDLLQTDMKIIEIAVQYSYESADAFTVAFKRLYGVAPATVRKTGVRLRSYRRVFFTLTLSYVNGENEMVIANVDRYRYTEPLFEGARIILDAIGAPVLPEYMQGISGAAFKIAGGCPSRPTCIFTKWTSDLIRALGYAATEYPCLDERDQDVSEAMLQAVMHSIDAGRPALVWHAFTNAEWDVVCGYDRRQKQFIGRGSNKGLEGYDRASWYRAVSCDICKPFGAIIVGEKEREPDLTRLEKESLREAVAHARAAGPHDAPAFEGIRFYREWAAAYRKSGKERDHADAYCYQVYSSSRRAAAPYLTQIAAHFPDRAAELLRKAADHFQEECEYLFEAGRHLSWESPWGVDEQRSQNVAPMLEQAAACYERAIACMEQALALL